MKMLEQMQTFDTSHFENRSLKIEKRWMTTTQAAEYLGTTSGHLRNLTSNGKVIYYKFGRLNRYLKEDLDNLILENKRGGYNGNY